MKKKKKKGVFVVFAAPNWKERLRLAFKAIIFGEVKVIVKVEKMLAALKELKEKKK